MQRAGGDRRRDAAAASRGRTPAARRGAQVARGLLHPRVERDGAGPHDDRHVARSRTRCGRSRSARIDPLALNSRAKNSSRLIPMTTSGVTIGSRISGVRDAPPPRRTGGAPAPGPAACPRIVVTTTEMSGDLEGDAQRAQQRVVREQLRVPLEREAAPDEVALGVVEAEQDQDDDRREQEHVDQARRERRQQGVAPPRISRSPRGGGTAGPATVPDDRERRSAGTRAPRRTASPCADRNRIWMTLAIVVVWAPPEQVRRDEVADRRDEREDGGRDDARASSAAASRAGTPPRPLAYRSRAAATSAGSRRSIET